MSTTTTGSGRKPNRRGLAAREQLMSTALRLLSTGRPEAVSVNLIAKEAGLSWGSVQNQFRDSDGFWAAVIELIIEAGPTMWQTPRSDTVAGRVAEVAELYRAVLDSPQNVAVETVRAALPRPLDVLAESHPHTAASIAELDRRWAEAFVHFFEGLDVDEQRALDVAAVLGSALRGLRSDQHFGTTVDVDRAHATLVAALTSYLEG
ncbi:MULTISPECIES: TetR/AcrR family transcriptional regulator [Nocardioides]|uniref:TetR/AcrR family transcriptional regulator n=1 Tax=Nocardioides vastitatis TaxID=2568655 RepID=A0ABW0ZJF6_9ACTN|nr:TetR/AcrR family transcriptional regulator [Nocardioides sp.]THJ16096.1 TetR/AcrR family transcriptional regulator [Nocardioides sp.]